MKIKVFETPKKLVGETARMKLSSLIEVDGEKYTKKLRIKSDAKATGSVAVEIEREDYGKISSTIPVGRPLIISVTRFEPA